MTKHSISGALFLGLLGAAVCSAVACMPEVGEDESSTDTEELRRRKKDSGAGDSAADSGAVADSGTLADSGTVEAAPPPPTGTTPTVYQEFNGWTGNTSPDGIWRIAGTWIGTGGNTLEPSNVRMQNGLLYLTSRANSLSGAELQTLPTYGYGYYET